MTTPLGACGLGAVAGSWLVWPDVNAIAVITSRLTVAENIRFNTSFVVTGTEPLATTPAGCVILPPSASRELPAGRYGGWPQGRGALVGSRRWPTRGSRDD
jgi:hypothetical protein